MLDSHMADDTVELRGPAPRDVIDVIDAECIARTRGAIKVSRMDRINEILLEHVIAKMREVQIITRLTRDSALLKDASVSGPVSVDGSER